MHDFEVGQTVKVGNVGRWAELASPGLAEGETILAMHGINRLRPSANLAIVTPARVILVDTTMNKFIFKAEYRIPGIVAVEAKNLTVLRLSNGAKEKIGPNGMRNQQATAGALAAAIERARRHPATQAVTARLPSLDPKDLFAPTLRPEPTLNAYGAQRPSLKDAKAVAKEGFATDVRIIGNKPWPKSVRIIQEHSAPGEEPWMVIHSSTAGVLAAFEDRLIIVKAGAMTSMMAGSFAGARAATFHFSDITGIEYNSGMLNGVLEILTPSYNGTANKDFWRGTTASRNADSNDPWTLSNTLPMDKMLHRQAQPHLNELRSKIATSKQRVVIAPPHQPIVSSPRPAPPPGASFARGGLAAEIAELAALRDAGVLSDEEFAAAKARLLGP